MSLKSNFSQLGNTLTLNQVLELRAMCGDSINLEKLLINKNILKINFESLEENLLFTNLSDRRSFICKIVKNKLNNQYDLKFSISNFQLGYVRNIKNGDLVYLEEVSKYYLRNSDRYIFEKRKLK